MIIELIPSIKANMLSETRFVVSIPIYGCEASPITSNSFTTTSFR